MKILPLLAGVASLPLLAGLPAYAAGATKAPAEIKIGDLRASSGPFASISMPVYYGLKLWVDQTNASGGVYVKAFDKKIPLKLISYDDQSNPSTAATLTDELIARDHVQMLVGDSGSVLTAVEVPIAQEHKVFLFDPTGTGAPFFTKTNPYIALIASPVSSVWPEYVVDYLDQVAEKAGIKTVAIVYCTNDFAASQAQAFKDLIEKGGKLKVVYYHGVPTSTSSYTVLINQIAPQHPDAVLEIGYPGNDIAFLHDLENSGDHFKFVFTVYAGSEPKLMEKAIGVQGLKNTFTYATGATYPYKVTTGMDLAEYKAAWEKAYPDTPGADFGVNAIAGYTTGIVLQEALAGAKSLDQMALRDSVFALSGKLVTLAGHFKLADTGGQLGELQLLGQMQANDHGGIQLAVVYPPEFATGKAIIGK